MLSGELADLAGVTVRALRHYHQVGVLAEPERSGNGYRSYDVHHLVRVLRIKRLAALGIPLDQMASVLDDADSDSSALLDELDVELAGQIERLTMQRSLIANVRDHGASPDLPPQLAPFFAAYASGLSPHVAKLDRELSVLLTHLAGDQSIPQLTLYAERLSGPDVLPEVIDLAERFGRLGPHSSASDVTALVDDWAVAVGSAIEELADPPTDLGGSAAFFDEYVTDRFNPQQREALERLVARLDSV